MNGALIERRAMRNSTKPVASGGAPVAIPHLD